MLPYGHKLALISISVLNVKTLPSQVCVGVGSTIFCIPSVLNAQSLRPLLLYFFNITTSCLFSSPHHANVHVHPHGFFNSFLHI